MKREVKAYYVGSYTSVLYDKYKDGRCSILVYNKDSNIETKWFKNEQECIDYIKSHRNGWL